MHGDILELHLLQSRLASKAIPHLYIWIVVLASKGITVTIRKKEGMRKIH
jgi:hypothetical protein